MFDGTVIDYINYRSNGFGQQQNGFGGGGAPMRTGNGFGGGYGNNGGGGAPPPSFGTFQAQTAPQQSFRGIQMAIVATD